MRNTRGSGGYRHNFMLSFRCWHPEISDATVSRKALPPFFLSLWLPSSRPQTPFYSHVADNSLKGQSSSTPNFWGLGRPREIWKPAYWMNPDLLFKSMFIKINVPYLPLYTHPYMFSDLKMIVSFLIFSFFSWPLSYASTLTMPCWIKVSYVGSFCSHHRSFHSYIFKILYNHF